ncbi:sushi, von Willebrand factor type A, EGF and pentraxin domain-containing protein 1 [Trichonephila inaurata madagascariensis]|uniref:Sushi, von Willebrand factor type A, EGF and pentraxin domain-containing protein 1 n=1 Tax=Trichonephila inaurata madagascariensis TaxID=2747483 RepID=A0A8X6YVK1_9ARAC|nr:sushi, von Willebrand factor type A, EGF and pentraxin domain-containing protein 1 [Trichonephila inaurata madagascariensis]
MTADWELEIKPMKTSLGDRNRRQLEIASNAKTNFLLQRTTRSCGPPGEIEHGTREGDVFTFTSRVTYNCSEGFEIIGRPYRYCQSNGQWSGQLPECRPVQCDKPANPQNGRAHYTSVSYNSVVIYECRFGFKLVGPSTRTCTSNKDWDGMEPACEGTILNYLTNFFVFLLL